MKAFAALAITMIWSSGAAAHSWYDTTCCAEQDCRPIPDSDVLELRQGWMTPTGWVPYGDGRVKPSLDGHYHICMSKPMESPFAYGDRNHQVVPPFMRCFYVPPRGF